ncbi:hypothetical protein GEMRC1_006295 [Eukaryota sp. GEM-RC1]
MDSLNHHLVLSFVFQWIISLLDGALILRRTVLIGTLFVCCSATALFFQSVMCLPFSCFLMFAYPGSFSNLEASIISALVLYSPHLAFFSSTIVYPLLLRLSVSFVIYASFRVYFRIAGTFTLQRLRFFTRCFICLAIFSPFICHDFLIRVLRFLNHLYSLKHNPIFLSFHMGIVLTMLVIVVCANNTRVKRISNTIYRKFFHFTLVIAVVLAYNNQDFLTLSMQLVMIAFFVVEVLCVFFNGVFGNLLCNFMNYIKDDKDSGTLVLSHFYLVFGLFLPFTFSFSSPIFPIYWLSHYRNW